MYSENDVMTANNFNNIENKILELNTRISNYGYTTIPYSKKTWTKNDYLIYTYLQNIENGIENLGLAYYKPYGWANKKTWKANEIFSYIDVNRWIDNLNLIEERLNKRTSGLFPSNSLYPSKTLLPR